MRAILIFCAVAMLAGCPATAPTVPQTVTVTKIVDTGCDWIRPISAAPADTLETKRQILAHDLAYQKNCPPKGSSK